MPPWEHVIAITVTTVVIFAVIYAGRRWPGRWVDRAAIVLAVAVVLAESGWWGINILNGTWTVRWSLPLHICEAGCFILAVALIWRSRFAFEMSYFWALGGTLPGLFTPDVPGHFPMPVYFQYYLEHGLLVLGAFYLVLVLRMRPAPGAVKRVSIATGLYAVVIGVVDYFTGGNYLFLRNVPPTRTFLDYLGPWPWYILTLTAMALVIFTLLYLPFARQASSRQALAQSGSA
jgi:hypothetical integral membrane protein (TIGR02206 family)